MKRSIWYLLISSFLFGFTVDRVYMIYSNYKEEEVLIKHVVEVENINYNHLLDSSYGTIVISSINKSMQTAAADVDFKIGIAKMYKWSIIGEKKNLKTNEYYIVSQTAFRLVQ